MEINLDKIGYDERLIGKLDNTIRYIKMNKLDYIDKNIIFYQYDNIFGRINYGFIDDKKRMILNIITLHHIIVFKKIVYVIYYYYDLEYKEYRKVLSFETLFKFSEIAIHKFYGYETFGNDIWFYFDDKILKNNHENGYVINNINTNIFHQKRNRLLSYARKLNLDATNTFFI